VPVLSLQKMHRYFVEDAAVSAIHESPFFGSPNEFAKLAVAARLLLPLAWLDSKISDKEFAQFGRVAKGSEAEVLNHLIDACDQRLITREELEINEQLAQRAMKAAAGLIRYLESTPDPPPPPYIPKKPSEAPD
jgi:hypothetical protein